MSLYKMQKAISRAELLLATATTMREIAEFPLIVEEVKASVPKREEVLEVASSMAELGDLLDLVDSQVRILDEWWADYYPRLRVRALELAKITTIEDYTAYRAKMDVYYVEQGLYGYTADIEA